MKKIKYLAVAYFLIVLAEACICPIVLHFFDFSEVNFSYNTTHFDRTTGLHDRLPPVGGNQTKLEKDQGLSLGVTTSGVTFLADLFDLSAGLVPSCYAFSECPMEGYEGLKYPLADIQITSNADWDGDHPKGSLLNDIVFYHNHGAYVDRTSYANSFRHQYSVETFLFPPPLASKEHVVTVRLVKSNGDVVEQQTKKITWVE